MDEEMLFWACIGGLGSICMGSVQYAGSGWADDMDTDGGMGLATGADVEAT